MKTTFAWVGTVLLLAHSALGAGTDYIIKQRAKELRDENNVRQGVPPPTQPNQPATAPARPAAPTLTPALARFQTDLAAINAGSQVSADQKQKLAQQLVASALVAKPSLATASKFTDHLANASAEKPLPASSRARLVQELDAVLNPGKYPQAKLDGIFSDIQAIFQENGLSRMKAVALSDSVKAMSTEIQQGGAK